MLKACCEWFSNALSSAGEKGYAVLPSHRHGRRMFLLQSRPFDRTADLSKLSVPGQPGMAVAIMVPLDFCPRCGRQLLPLVNEQTEAFDAEAIRLSPLLTE